MADVIRDFYKVEEREIEAMVNPTWMTVVNPQRVVILDRDGVINEDYGYVSSPTMFEFCEGAVNAMYNLSAAGFTLFCISNQSAIGRGMADVTDVLRTMEFMREIVRANRSEIREVVFCPHSPDENCRCRKPGTLMLQYLAEKYKFKLRDAWLIGDKKTDVEMGNKMNCRTIRLRPKGDEYILPQNLPDSSAHDLAAAAEYILEETR